MISVGAPDVDPWSGDRAFALSRSRCSVKTDTPCAARCGCWSIRSLFLFPGCRVELFFFLIQLVSEKVFFFPLAPPRALLVPSNRLLQLDLEVPPRASCRFCSIFWMLMNACCLRSSPSGLSSGEDGRDVVSMDDESLLNNPSC